MENNKRRKTGQNYLTEDLIIEIISRVSAKNLVRFTCVSKSWCSLIRTDPYLSRLQRTASLYRPFLFIQEMNDPCSPAYRIWSPCYNYWIDLDSIEAQSINLREIDNPFSRWTARVVASCHDLLVLRRWDGKIAVSNPITRKHVVVPPNPAGDSDVVFYGFGYDRVHDCYKLLTRVIHRGYNRHNRNLELMVFDLDKGTWKRLQFATGWNSQFQETHTLLCYYWDFCSAKCVDGAVYWFIHKKDSVMVCFLLAEEEFHVVEPPDLGPDTKYYSNSMTIFDGKVGLVCKGLNTGHEFWSIGMDYDDAGERQWQWTKLLAIPDLPSHFIEFEDNDFLSPVCFSACKNKILFHQFLGYQLLWYDMVKKEFDKLKSLISGRCQDGKFLWYDMIRRKVRKLNNRVDGRIYTSMRIL